MRRPARPFPVTQQQPGIASSGKSRQIIWLCGIQIKQRQLPRRPSRWWHKRSIAPYEQNSSSPPAIICGNTGYPARATAAYARIRPGALANDTVTCSESGAMRAQRLANVNYKINGGGLAICNQNGELAENGKARLAIYAAKTALARKPTKYPAKRPTSTARARRKAANSARAAYGGAKPRRRVKRLFFSGRRSNSRELPKA